MYNRLPNQPPRLRKIILLHKTTLTVVRYQATNNKVDVVDTKVYHANSFKNRAEFEDFCEKQFDSIDRKFSEEMNKILNHFEEAKRNIKNK